MMYRAYIKDLDEFDYNDVPHKGHFVYGNLIKGKPNDDVDAIVGDLIEINDEYVNVEFWKSIEKDSAEQYIGLKDVNGKEIYEGDIVTVQATNDDGSTDGMLGKIVYDDDIASFEFTTTGKGGWYTSSFDNLFEEGFFDIHVIGNVHANPELLEAQHE
ncbi:hypothetical protein LBR_12480 [Levilactobacillus brevis]|nr:hypothetical protein LBR_12480 [Levilactobacillus brevis]